VACRRGSRFGRAFKTSLPKMLGVADQHYPSEIASTAAPV